LLLLALFSLPITPAVLSAEEITAFGIGLDGAAETGTDVGPAGDVPAVEQRPEPREDAPGAEAPAEEAPPLVGETPDETTFVWVEDLEAGDCFDERDPAAAIVDEVALRPCTEPHEKEVFAVVELPAAGDVRYDEEQIFIDGERACEGAFEGYVGISYDDSALWLFFIYPDRSAWRSGDRMVTCALYDGDERPLVGSMADSGR
jgi:hypothetical protein